MNEDKLPQAINELTLEMSSLLRENNELLREIIAEVKSLNEAIGDLKMEIRESTASIMGQDGFNLQDVASQLAATEDRITGGTSGEGGASLRSLEDSLETQAMLLLTREND